MGAFFDVWKCFLQSCALQNFMGFTIIENYMKKVNPRPLSFTQNWQNIKIGIIFFNGIYGILKFGHWAHFSVVRDRSWQSRHWTNRRIRTASCLMRTGIRWTFLKNYKIIEILGKNRNGAVFYRRDQTSVQNLTR